LAQAFRGNLETPTERARALKAPVLEVLRVLSPVAQFGDILEIADMILWADPTDRDVNAFLDTAGFPDCLRPQLDAFRADRVLKPGGSIRHPSVRSPFGLALNPATGTLAVANEQASSVSLFDSDGRFLREVKHPGRLSVGLAYDGDGSLWVATASPEKDNLFVSDPALAEWTALACSRLAPEHPIPWFVCEHMGRVYVQLSAPSPYEESLVASFRRNDPENSLLLSGWRMGMPGGIAPFGSRLLVAQRLPAALWSMAPDGSDLRPLAEFAPWEQILGVQSDGDAIFLSTLRCLVKVDAASGRVIFSAEPPSTFVERPSGIVLDGATLFMADYSGNTINRYTVRS
jgi:hypothetical protein